MPHLLMDHLHRWVAAEPTALVTSDGLAAYTTSRLLDEVGLLVQELRISGLRRMATWMDDSPILVVAMLAAEATDTQVYLIHPELPVEAVREIAAAHDIDACISGLDRPVIGECTRVICSRWRIWRRAASSSPCQQARESSEPKVIIFTSGTTGIPKPVEHTWAGLAGPVRVKPELTGVRWLTLYGLTRYAGLQVFLQAFLTQSLLVIPRDRSPGNILAVLLSEKVTHASGTPSLWRRVALCVPPGGLDGLCLRQITLGGEPAHQATLDLIRERFPGVRVTHTYAATEVGMCFSASDGREGFPIRELLNNPRGIQCKIVEGQLYIRSKYSRLDVPARWVPTGDAVRVEGDRFYVLGRQDGCINVGGSKVYPGEVERVILLVPGVKEVKVYGQRSSVLGQLVKAEIVVEDNVDREAMKARILDCCRSHLEAYKVPRLIEFRSALRLTSAGKVDRKNG